MRAIPRELHGRAFTVPEAERLGVGRRMLQGDRFVRMHAGVYRTAITLPTFELQVRAALLVLPHDSALSHLSALRLLGLAIGPERPLHFSTNQRSPIVRPGLVVHRRQQLLRPLDHDNLPVLDPVRTFVDVATQLDDRRLLRVGDWIVRNCDVDPWALRSFVIEQHLDGVQRARRVAPLVRAGVDSPRESDVRWLLHRAGLPEPDVNPDIHAPDGSWLARGDLVYREQKVIVEYDGWHHERDARQRQWDHLRREQLERAGWRLIVITAEDMKKPGLLVARVRQALRDRAVA